MARSFDLAAGLAGLGGPRITFEQDPSPRGMDGRAVMRAATRDKPDWRPEAIAYPWKPIRQRGLRGALRELASIIARGFWQEAYPCCLAHRYGHGWQHGDRQPLTRGGGEIDYTAIKPRPGWVPYGVEAARSWQGATLVRDFALFWQGPPAACPVCGRRPPRALMRRWQQYVDRWAR